LRPSIKLMRPQKMEVSAFYPGAFGVNRQRP
jgi:hypothetical protein